MTRRRWMKLAATALGWAMVGRAAGMATALAEPANETPATQRTPMNPTNPMLPKVVKSEDEWRKLLTPEQFAVCRKKGTERAFTGKDWDNHEAGIYKCVACGTPVFSSETKFESGTGWPSFWAPIDPHNVETEEDSGLFMRRTEVHCAVCGAHLGHVFSDGPQPTGLRYCLNSVCLNFDPKK